MNADAHPGGRPRSSPIEETPFVRWCRISKLAGAEIARRIRVKPSTVYNLRRGDFTPSLALAIRIEDLTGGKVSVRSWPGLKVE